MAIKAKLLSVALNTVTGNQAITGVGFQPEVVMGLLTDLTGSTGAANQNVCFFGTKSSTKGCMSAISGQDSVVSDFGAANFFNNAPGIRIVDPDSVTIVSANLVSVDSDGITINIVTAPAAGFLLHLLCLQDDTGNAIQTAMGSFTCNTSPGNQDITGLGFDSPDCVIFHQAYARTAGGTGTGTGNLTNQTCVGFTDGTNQAASYIYQSHGANPSNTKRGFRSDRCFHQEGQSSTLLSLSYVQGITDGFRVNINTTSGTAWTVTYIALKGINAKVINHTSSTGTGTTSITGAGFSPSAILGIESGVQVETVQDNSRMSIGFATSPTARANVSVAALDNILNTSNVSEKLSTTSFLIDLTANHGSPTDANRWDIQSIDSDGFTYDHEVADGGAILMAFLMLGVATAGNQTVTPTGIATSVAFGTPNVFTGSQAQTINPTGIPSSVAFGTPVVGGAKIVQPVGIPSGDYHVVEVTGTFDDTAFDPQFTQYKVELIDGPDPRSIFGAFGTSLFVFTPAVAPGDYTVRLSLSNADGSVTSNVVTTTLTIGGVGRPTIIVGGGGGASIIQPPGIPSSELFGNPFINMEVLPTGIATSEAFGSPTIVTGGLAVGPVGIPSSEAFGNPTIISDQLLFIVGIPSSEDFGIPQVTFEGGQILNIEGIETSEQFGTVTVTVPAPGPQWPPITDPDTVWTRIPPGREG